MTEKFRDLSIRVKLIILLGASAAIALTISSLLILYYTFNTSREDSLQHLRQISAIGGENLRAAVAFHDSVSATKMLASLKLDPHILAVVIFAEETGRFSSYVSPAASPDRVEGILDALAAIARPHADNLAQLKQGMEGIRWDYMYSIAPITFEGKIIGTVAIVSDTHELKSKMFDYLVIQTLISLLTLGVIIFISIRLQRLFTTPIFDMISTIREIAATKNFSLTLDSRQNDEFSVLHGHFNDMIAEIRERDERLIRLATTDPLTGLANRRHAMETMKTMVTRSCRRHEPFGIIVFDVDHFKNINDSYGHPVGDVVLRQVAEILAGAAREYDLVARVGGEEFLVLCDNGSQETTWTIAERMRARVEEASIEYDEGKKLRVTISAGAYSAVPATEEIEVFLRIADDQLYLAKHEGRNRVKIKEIPA